jgi:hypothetical protein
MRQEGFHSEIFGSSRITDDANNPTVNLTLMRVEQRFESVEIAVTELLQHVRRLFQNWHLPLLYTLTARKGGGLQDLSPTVQKLPHAVPIEWIGMRLRLAAVIAIPTFVLVLVLWHLRTSTPASAPAASNTSPITPSAAATASASPESAPTAIYAHNLMLRKGPNFRIYVRWLRGKMVRTRKEVNPTFDDPESFFLDINTGVIRANIGDIGNYLNAGGVADSPLKNITLLADGDQIRLKGTLHKLVSLPVELLGSVTATADNRIQLHITKLNVLKIPLKGLLGGLHVSLSDLIQPKGIPGVEISGNEIFFDTVKLLPPPHIHGQLTKVRVVTPDIEEVFGNAEDAAARVEQWRNFLRLNDGTIDFGKLTMHHVDLIMVDLSDDAWFDLDLNNYQNQLVNGYTRMTPEAGLQIFMPDLDSVPKSKGGQNISMEWLKHRNLPPPPDITSK